jgi:hypothetical protein
MHRDMDTVRHLLLWIESDRLHEIPATIQPQELAYHAQLLIDGGLAEGTVHYSAQRGRRVPDKFYIERLTWAGHDLLEAARNDTHWKQAKKKIVETGSSWTFEVLKALLSQYAKASLGIP